MQVLLALFWHPFMAKSRHSTRQHLIDTAKDLFVKQGITQTTTRQIADTAAVNEVTLFRHFGTKQGLLLAVFADLGVFDGVGDLSSQLMAESDPYVSLLVYMKRCFRALAHNPELVRSVVGEAGQFSELHRQALKQGFCQAQDQFAHYLRQSIPADSQPEIMQASAVLHLLILGMAVLDVTAGLPVLPSDMANTSEPTSPLEDQWLDCCLQFWLSSLNL